MRSAEIRLLHPSEPHSSTIDRLLASITRKVSETPAWIERRVELVWSQGGLAYHGLEGGLVVRASLVPCVHL